MGDLAKLAAAAAAAAAALAAAAWWALPPAPGPSALRSPCESVRTYALGSVDSRFLKSEFELRSDLEEASAVWNATQRKPLLAFEPEAGLRVDFVYDEREALSAVAEVSKSQLEERERFVKPEADAFKADAARFNERQRELNGRIDSWNRRGGAPPDEAEKLRAEQASLDDDLRKLKEREAAVRANVGSLEGQGRLYNQTVRSLNDAIHDKPEQGLYEGGKDRITIWFAGSREELLHTLAHELGHALGLGHTDDASGVMYPYTTSSLTLSPADKKALAEVCRRRVPSVR